MEILSFLGAALPWVALGFGLALAFAGWSHVRKGNSLPLGYAALATLCFALALAGFVWPQYHAQALPSQDEQLERELESSGSFARLGRDLVWAGDSASFNGVEAENDILAAGRNVRIEGARVDGSVRAAGQHVTLNTAEVKDGVTVAGQSVLMDAGSARYVAMAGKDASFAGSTKQLMAASASFALDGTVDGDASICADKVEVGPNTVVSGTLHVESSQEPAIFEGAKIGKLDYVKSSGGVSSIGTIGGLGIFGLSVFGSILLDVLGGVLGFLAMAALCEWLLRRQTKGAAELLRQRPGALLGTGVVAMLASPLAVLLLCALLVTLPVAAALAMALFAATMVGGGFLAAVLGKLAFPKMGRFASALLMALILGAVHAMPFVGGVVTVAGFAFLLGYVLQKLWLGRGTIQAA